jgi:phage host-nuclease inhibitor protein Gam
MIVPQLLIPECDPDTLDELDREIASLVKKLHELCSKRDELTKRYVTRPIQIGDRF